jgi:hypothetical protein
LRKYLEGLGIEKQTEYPTYAVYTDKDVGLFKGERSIDLDPTAISKYVTYTLGDSIPVFNKYHEDAKLYNQQQLNELIARAGGLDKVLEMVKPGKGGDKYIEAQLWATRDKLKDYIKK